MGYLDVIKCILALINNNIKNIKLPCDYHYEGHAQCTRVECHQCFPDNDCLCDKIENSSDLIAQFETFAALCANHNDARCSAYLAMLKQGTDNIANAINKGGHECRKVCIEHYEGAAQCTNRFCHNCFDKQHTCLGSHKKHSIYCWCVAGGKSTRIRYKQRTGRFYKN
jgi:hypothetical protein